jgi:hypothetical protein
MNEPSGPGRSHRRAASAAEATKLNTTHLCRGERLFCAIGNYASLKLRDARHLMQEKLTGRALYRWKVDESNLDVGRKKRR